MKNKIIIFCMLSLLWAACSEPASEEIGFGHFEGNRYFNEYFGFKINFPKAWSIQDQQSTDYISEVGVDLLAGEDENMKAILRAAEPRVVNLFAVFKFMVGSPVDSNPNIMCSVESLNSFPGIKRGSDYLFNVKELLNSGSLEYNFFKEIYTEDLDGNDFDVLEAEVYIGELKVKQLYYVSIVKGYSLAIILTYSTEAEKFELLDVIKTIEFSQSYYV